MRNVVLFMLLLLVMPSAVATAAAHDDDIDACWVQRLPSLPYVWGSTNATRDGWPAEGSSVVWRAYVKNWGTTLYHDVDYTWSLDGVMLTSGIVTLATQAYTTIDLAWPWTFNRHELSFAIDPEDRIPEFSELNNQIVFATDAISLGMWVERGLYDMFHADQKNLNIGANGWEDWGQRQVQRWNQMFERAVTPTTLNGVVDRIRLDQIHVVENGALPLNGGLPTNNPDFTNRTVDLQWGFPATLTYGDRTTVSDNNSFYFEGSLIHELGHARYLVDVYGFNAHENPAKNPPNPPWFSNVLIQVNGVYISGTPYLPVLPPWADAVYFPNGYGSVGYGLMSGPYNRIDQYSGTALNLIAGRRAVQGNYNSPGNIGVYLQNLPTQNILRVTDAFGAPLTNAILRVYQAGAKYPDWYGKRYDNTPDLVLATDSTGYVAVGRCPFSTNGIITHTYGLANGVIIVGVDTGDRIGFQFMDAMHFNLAYWSGQTQTANHALAVAMIGTTPAIAGVTPPDGYSTPLGSAYDIAVVTSGTNAPQSVRVNGAAANYYHGAWRRSVTPAKGTNTLTIVAAWQNGAVDTQIVQHIRVDAAPPEIGREALLFPSPGARLIAGRSVNVRWIKQRITDDADGENCIITRLAVYPVGSTDEVAVVGVNLPNNGARLWTVPAALTSSATWYVLRATVRDGSYNSTNRTFDLNRFMVATNQPPWIAADALTYPTNGAVLLSAEPATITWLTSRITDDYSDVNCVITTMTVYNAATTQSVAIADTAVNNTLGARGWTPPVALESMTTRYVLGFAVRDTDGNGAERIFWGNVFGIVPEPALPALLAVASAWVWRRRRAVAAFCLLTAGGFVASAAPTTVTDAGRVPASQLHTAMASSNRAEVAAWARGCSIAEMNAAVQSLSATERRQLIAQTLDMPGASDAERQRLVDGAGLVLDNPLLCFYIELLATTQIRLHDAASGGYAAGDHISLGRGLLATTNALPLRNTIAHEMFHIFNAQNRASVGISGLNEGTAIWIFKCAFPDTTDAERALGLAEPTFGTMNFYRDIGIKNYPKEIPLGIPTKEITPKGREVYENILMARDPSKLPLFDEARMTAIYTKYFQPINRNQPFDKWLDAFRAAHAQMLRDLTPAAKP